MTAYQQNLSEIFSNREHPENLILFRKLILLAREGLLQVNGQFPDASKSLFENLIEGHSFVVDLTQLDSNYRHKLKTWLLDPHQNDCSYSFWEGYVNNDYRGYTVEVPLSLWGRLWNWLFGSVETAYWQLATKKKLSPDFQLHGFTLQTGKQGWLIEFKSMHLEKLFSLKQDEENLEQARNSRRIILTPGIVDKLVKVETVDDRIEEQLNQAHPLSIKVKKQHKSYREKMMAEFRKTEFIEENQSWYVLLWRWVYNASVAVINFVRSFWQENKLREDIEPPVEDQFTKAATKHSLFENEQIKITEQNGVFQVVEKWPGYSNIIFSGGGGKIFSLVGAYRACREMGIPFKAYAGSSAGAIMSILAYLGYEPEQIQRFFADFNREILLYNEWDKTGYSKTTALKAGLDYAIALKVLEIINRYQIDKTEEGREFLNNEVFNTGKILFRSLEKLKQRYPDCGFGDNLIMTASNLITQRTTYFSTESTPDEEVSHAGEMSASMPGVFKPPLWNNIPHTDGGLTSNFPIEKFIGKDKSILSSRYGYSLESLGFYFDNGYEQGMLNDFRRKIYRESKISNMMYQFISGIQDPVSAWEWDRIKMVQQSFTTVLLSAEIASTQFSVPLDKQVELIEKGYEETMRHFNYLYSPNKADDGYHPNQYMYENFQSMEAILVHCCFRQNEALFKALIPIAKQHGVKQDRIDLLARRFDKPDPKPTPSPTNFTPPTVCRHNSEISHSLSNLLMSRGYMDKMRFFVYLYPIFLRLRLNMFENKKDYDVFCKARHGTSIRNPLYALAYLKDLSSNQHLVLYLVIHCMKRYHYQDYGDICLILKNLSEAIVDGSLDLNANYFINNWSNLLNDGNRLDNILSAVREKDWPSIVGLATSSQMKVLERSKVTSNDISSSNSEKSQFNSLDGIKSCVC